MRLRTRVFNVAVVALALTWGVCLGIVEVWQCGRDDVSSSQCTRSTSVEVIAQALPTSLTRAAVVIAVPDRTGSANWRWRRSGREEAPPVRCKGASPPPSAPVVEVSLVVEKGHEKDGERACLQLFGDHRAGFQDAASLLGACVDFRRACSELATDIPAVSLWDGGVERLRGPLAPTVATASVLSPEPPSFGARESSKRTALRWIGPPVTGCLAAMRDRQRYKTGATAAGEKESCAAGGDMPWARVAFAATVSRRRTTTAAQGAAFFGDVTEQLSAPVAQEHRGGGVSRRSGDAWIRRAEDLAALGGQCIGRGRRSLVRSEEMEQQRQTGKDKAGDGFLSPPTPLGLHRVLRSDLEVECRGGSRDWADTGGAGTACELGLFEQVPSGAYVDLDELRSLQTYRSSGRGGAPFFLSSPSDAIDVERPTELSRQHAFALNIPLPALSFSSSSASGAVGGADGGEGKNGVIFRLEVLPRKQGERNEAFASLLVAMSLPLHLRYQMPAASDRKGFAATVLPPPQVYARCRGDGGRGLETRPWSPVEMSWESSQGGPSVSNGAGLEHPHDFGDIRASVCHDLARQRFDPERLLSQGYLCLSVPVGWGWHGPVVAASTLLASTLAAIGLIALALRASQRGEKGADRAGWAEGGFGRFAGLSDGSSRSTRSSGNSSEGDNAGALTDDIDFGLRRRKN